MPKQLEGHVFIITYGRSGSTVVQKVLQSIPGYFIRGENNHTLYPMYLAYRRAFEARFSHGKREHPPEAPWYGADAINPSRFGYGLADLFKKEIIQAPEDSRVIGFKEIRFHEAGEELFEPYLDFIFEMFPGSKFIFNMRRWQDVTKSSWWATMDPEAVRKIIEGADALYQRYAAKHSSRCHMMYYEQYCDNAAAFAPLLEFLEESYEQEKVADIIEKRLSHSPAVVGGYAEGNRKLAP